MKTWIVFLVCFCAAPFLSFAQENLRVAVVTGGHDFDKKAFKKLFEGHGDLQVHYAQCEIFDSIDPWEHHVLVLYNMTQTIYEIRRKNFLTLLQRGVGLVVFHHAIAAFPDWPEFAKIIGGKYDLKKSGYSHDVNFMVRVKDPAHPITWDLWDFPVFDETYIRCSHEPDIRPLLFTEHPKSDPWLAWVKTYQNSRVFYMQVGHGPGVYAQKEFRRVMAQAIRWAGKTIEEDFAKAFARALHEITTYDYGQSRKALTRIKRMIRNATWDPERFQEMERQLLAALKTETTHACKDFICRRLSVVGSENCLPVLNELKKDPQLSSMAMYALERIENNDSYLERPHQPIPLEKCHRILKESKIKPLRKAAYRRILFEKGPMPLKELEQDLWMETLSWLNKRGRNLAPKAIASSPDGLSDDGDSKGDGAGNDNNPLTFWDEQDNQPLYCYQLDFEGPQKIAAISIMGYHHHDYAPRDFSILCDGKLIKEVTNARYHKNLLVVELPDTECKTLLLKITGCYGASPAIRELGLYSFSLLNGEIK